MLSFINLGIISTVSAYAKMDTNVTSIDPSD